MMKDRIKKDKAFLGAIMAGVNMVGGIAKGIAQRKAQKRMMRKQLSEQTRQAGIQQASAMTQSYDNQDYVDEYNNKIEFRYGGKKKHYSDRIKNAKKYKCGGIKKASFGVELANSFKGNKLGGSLATIMNTTGNTIGNAIAPNTNQQVIPKTEFVNNNIKTSLEKPSYTFDANGNPVTALNTNDRIQVAKMGKRYIKRR